MFSVKIMVREELGIVSGQNCVLQYYRHSVVLVCFLVFSDDLYVKLPKLAFLLTKLLIRFVCYC